MCGTKYSNLCLIEKLLIANLIHPRALLTKWSQIELNCHRRNKFTLKGFCELLNLPEQLAYIQVYKSITEEILVYQNIAILSHDTFNIKNKRHVIFCLFLIITIFWFSNILWFNIVISLNVFVFSHYYFLDIIVKVFIWKLGENPMKHSAMDQIWYCHSHSLKSYMIKTYI